MLFHCITFIVRNWFENIFSRANVGVPIAIGMNLADVSRPLIFKKLGGNSAALPYPIYEVNAWLPVA